MADRAQAVRAKWWPYAGVAPIGQAIAATTMPRAHSLTYLLHRARLASSVLAEPSAMLLRFAAESTPLPSSLAVVSVLTPASPQLRHSPL